MSISLAPPEPNSFPTRRSSDLRSASGTRAVPGPPLPPRTSRNPIPRRFSAKPANDSRSEEHTSELQSPCNLVCRLMLETKEQKYMQINNQRERKRRTNDHINKV